MSRRERWVCATVAGAVVGLLALALSAEHTAGPERAVPSQAVAYHGAWQLYRNLAVYFGQRALLAEAAYWRCVQ